MVILFCACARLTSYFPRVVKKMDDEFHGISVWIKIVKQLKDVLEFHNSSREIYSNVFIEQLIGKWLLTTTSNLPIRLRPNGVGIVCRAGVAKRAGHSRASVASVGKKKTFSHYLL